VRFRSWPAGLAALAAPLPLIVYNPDFARGPLEWMELLLGSLALVFAFAGLGVLVARLAGREPHAGAALGVFFALALAFGLVGWIVAGLWGLVLALAALGLLGALGFRITPLGRLGALPAALAATLIVIVLAIAGRAPAPERQLVMIGLDGTTWELVDRFRAKGDMPHFDRLIETGTSARLETLEPILSPPIWTSIATGKTPEEHGILDFWASSDQVRAKRLWEIADEAGLHSGVLGYLVTWPPRKESGFLVPGWMAQGPETVPPSLSFLKRLERSEKAGTSRPLFETAGLAFSALRHGVTLKTLNASARVLLRRKLGPSESRLRDFENRHLKFYFTSDVFCHLLRRTRPELAIYYDSAVDAIEHLFFKYYEPEGFPSVTEADVEAVGHAIPTIYRQADEAVGRIAESSERGANLLLVSDHGQEAARTEGERWYAVRTTELLRELRIQNALRATNIAGSVYLRAIDPGADVTGAWEAIRAVVTPDGRPLFELELSSPTEASITARDDFDHRLVPTVELQGREIATAKLVRPSERISGRHTKTAFFLVHGPDAARGRSLDGATVLDVAPTVLALLRLPVARDMPGRVLEEAFRPDFFRGNRLRWVESHGQPEGLRDDDGDSALDPAVLEKLKALGYVE